ncbi:hypothetical protein [Sphingomonas sp. R86521]|uniref:hypothetical protein n=1 Tax=Sphingomonas sp. R86521 TaxID=3093860 RepID=UPI0036D43767
MPTDPKNDIERETTGEPYVEGNMETKGVAPPDGSSVEDINAVSEDTPDSLTTDGSDTDAAADSLSVRGDGEAPDSAP